MIHACSRCGTTGHDRRTCSRTLTVPNPVIHANLRHREGWTSTPAQLMHALKARGVIRERATL